MYTVIYLCDLDHISCIHRCFAVLIWEPKLLAVWLWDNEPFVFNVVKFYLSCSFCIIPLLYCLLYYHLWWNKGFHMYVCMYVAKGEFIPTIPLATPVNSLERAPVKPLITLTCISHSSAQFHLSIISRPTARKPLHSPRTAVCAALNNLIRFLYLFFWWTPFRRCGLVGSCSYQINNCFLETVRR